MPDSETTVHAGATCHRYDWPYRPLVRALGSFLNTLRSMLRNPRVARAANLSGVLFSTIYLSCTRAPEPRVPNPLEAPPVDSSRIRSPDEPSRWGYRRALTADLNGDRRDERLVIASDVTLGPDGNPIWEDGHRWAVVVEAPEGRTLLYAAFVPNGFVEAAALAPDDAGRRRVLVQERTPSTLRALEVEYEGPGAAKLRSGAYYRMGTWLEGSARMP